MQIEIKCQDNKSYSKTSVIYQRKMDKMENIRKTVTNEENFTINIVQESCERASFIDYQTSYNTPCTIALCNSKLSQIQPSNPQLVQQQKSVK